MKHTTYGGGGSVQVGLFVGSCGSGQRFAGSGPSKVTCGQLWCHAVIDLGVMLDSKMTMSQHVSRVCQNCYFQIRLIRRLGKALSVESKLLLVHALVHSRLDYCNSVSCAFALVSCPAATVCVEFCCSFDFWLEALLITLHLPWWILHWLPYPQRIKYKLCMIMFKCLRGSAPAYLADYCTSTSLVPGRSALRSAAQGDIVVPSHRTDWGLRSFAVAGPQQLECFACLIWGLPLLV